MSVTYVHLMPGQNPPELGQVRPFRAVVVLEQATSPDWLGRVSEWLVASGCLYMMAWGEGCEAFHDRVDQARDAPFDGADIPDDQLVMTTWHDDEPLSETFWFAEHTACHPTVSIDETVILDVGPHERRAHLTEMLEAAQKRTS